MRCDVISRNDHGRSLVIGEGPGDGRSFVISEGNAVTTVPGSDKTDSNICGVGRGEAAW